MKKKLTPPEKKELAYDKDHRTHTGEADRAMRRLWAKRKARLNRNYRRLTDQLLREATRPDVIDAVLAEENGTTRELIRKGLTRKNNSKKWGVGTLRDAVEAKLKSRRRPRETNHERKERLSKSCMGMILALEHDPDSPEAVRLKKILRFGGGEFWSFFKDHPEWKARLLKKLTELEKVEQRQLEKARLEAEQKRKWRSPTVRLPRDSQNSEAT
jgi:hypothetical protein